MSNFIKRIHTDFGYPEFFFNRIFTATGTCFHVSVFDKERKSSSFNMKEVNGKWIFVHPNNCPSWITRLEDKLGVAIQEHLEMVQ